MPDKEQVIVEYVLQEKGGDKVIATIDDITESSNKAGTALTNALSEKQIDSATEKLTKFNTTVEKTTEEFSSAKAELNSLTKQITSGALAGKDLELAKKRAGELKDRIGDVRTEIGKLASDTRVFDTLVEGGRAVAASMSLAQGAAALFGDENKDLQKALLRTQGALAVLTGAQELANVLTTKGGIATQAYGFALKAVEGIQKAFAVSSAAAWGIATAGVGLLVAGVVSLISYLSDAGDATEKFVSYADELDKQRENSRKRQEEILASLSEADKAFFDKQTDRRNYAVSHAEDMDQLRLQQLKESLEHFRSVYIGYQVGRQEDDLVDDEKRKERLKVISEYIINAEKERNEIQVKLEKERLAKFSELQKQEIDQARMVDQALEEGAFRTANHIKEFADRVAQAKQSTDEPLITEKTVDETAKNAEDAANAEAYWINYSVEQYRKAQEEKRKLIDATFAAATSAAASLASLTASVFANETSALQQQKDRQLALAGENSKQREKIEKDFAIKSAEIKRKQAIAEKAFALVNIGINTASAIMKQLSVTPLPAGAPFVALLAATAALQTAAVLAQPLPEIPKFKEGVIGFKGKGTDTSDENLVLISNNESVIKAKATSKYRDELQAANDLNLESFIYHKYLLPVLQQKAASDKEADQYDDHLLRRTIKEEQKAASRYIVNGIIKGLGSNQNYSGYYRW